MRARVSGLVWLPKDELGPSVDRIKKKLRIVPKIPPGYSDEKPKPINCWAENDSEIGLPREYFFSTATKTRPDEITWELGYGSKAVYDSLLKQEGPYAEQGEVIDAICDWFHGADESDVKSGRNLGFTLKADPGFGKSNCALAAAHRLQVTTVILVHKERLMDQWVGRAEEFLPGVKVGICKENVCDFEDKHIVVAMMQSLAMERYGPRYPREFYDWPGLLVLDEGHRVGAGTWSPLPGMFPARWRLMCSATPRRNDGADKVFWWHIGPIRFDAKTERPKPKVRMVESGIDRVPSFLQRQGVSPSLVINYLARNRARNEVVVSEMVKALSAKSQRKLLILSERLDQLRDLEVMLKAACEKAGIDDITTGFYVGEWYTGDVQEKLSKTTWDMENGGRHTAIDIIFKAFRRRKGLEARPEVDCGRSIKAQPDKHSPEQWINLDDELTSILKSDRSSRDMKRALSDFDKMLFYIARTNDIRQKRVEKKKKLTNEQIREAERARVVFMTYQMSCVDIDTEVVDPLTGDVSTLRDSIVSDAPPMVITGRDRCTAVFPSGGGFNGKKRCVEVVAGGIGKRSMVLTPDHMVWTQRGWVEAGSLVAHSGDPSGCLGDYIATPRKLDVDEVFTRLSEDDAWLLGLLMADGSLSFPQRGTFELTSNDDELVENATSVLRSHGMFLVKSRHQHWSTRTENGKSGRGKKSWLREELERLGMCSAAHDKSVPMEIMVAHEVIVRNFLSGYIDGDGCVSAVGRVSFSSVSRRLVEQIRTLLLRLSIPTKNPLCSNGCWVVTLGRSESIEVRRTIPMRLSRKRDRIGLHDARRLGVGDFTMVPPQWTVDVVKAGRDKGFLVKDMAKAAGVLANKLSAKVPMLARHKHDAICRLIGEPVLNEALAWLPVRSVDGVGEREVGDFSVPPDKSWAVNGMIIHNSEGIDVPAADTIGFASPISDVEQSYGRGRRECVPKAHGGDKSPATCEHYCPWRHKTCRGKPDPRAFDVVDRNVNLSVRRERYRLEFYEEVGAVVRGS